MLDVEILAGEMFAAGERLKFALDLESKLSRQRSREQDAALLTQWQECRDSVERFSEDYAAAIRAWRRAVVSVTALKVRGDSQQSRKSTGEGLVESHGD